MPRKATAASSNPPMEVHTTIQMPPQASEKPLGEEKPDFWSFMQRLTPEQWKNHIVYVTRENPKTSINGVGGYLTKLQQAFDIEDIKVAFGGYEFSYIMKKGNDDIIYSGRFRIEAPPKYDPARELATAAPVAAAAGVTVGGDLMKILEQQNQRLYEVLTTLQGREGDPAVSGAIDILTSAYKKGLDAVATQQPVGDNATKQLDDVLAIAERIVSVRGGGNGNGLTETIALLSSLGVLNKPKTLAEQLTEAKTLVDLLGGGGEGNPKDWKAMGVKALVDHLPEILDALKTSTSGTISAARARMPAPAAQPAARGPAPATRQPPAPAPPAPAIHVTGGLQVVPRDSGDTAAAAAVPVENTAPAGTPETQEQYDAAMKIQMVNMMRMGASGGAIASFLEDVKPEMAKDLTKYDSTTITNFFRQDEVLRLMVEDPRWNEVLADAKEYLSEEVLAN
jgi:hypothetical protein